MTIEERAKVVAWQIFEEIGLSKHSVDRVSEIIEEKMCEQKAIDIDNACSILCHHVCPYNSNQCNAKCDTWKNVRKNDGEIMETNYYKAIIHSSSKEIILKECTKLNANESLNRVYSFFDDKVKEWGGYYIGKTKGEAIKGIIDLFILRIELAQAEFYGLSVIMSEQKLK